MNQNVQPIEIAKAIMASHSASAEAIATAVVAHALLEIAEALRAFVEVVKENA